ncbi:autotransporter outer membrane beta-barrel domain-containing protein, partial [Polynucleobacter sp. AP-RePozz3-80-G7]|nr:autotransporter outer membrane beta-barrel domain-containing protein [Polynucleobacter sp. AP-RePozz3-80-G7]
GTGSIATSSSLINNATFDISGTTSGASIISLSGNSSGSVVLGSKTLTMTNAADTFAGVISGTNGNLVISGGTQVLTNTNTYSGTTTINSGATLQIGNAGTVGTLGTGTVTDNGTLILNRSDAITIANAISGT